MATSPCCLVLVLPSTAVTVQEQEWLHLLVQLKSSIAKCPRCGSEMFIESNGETMCPDCKSLIKPVGYLKFAKNGAGSPPCLTFP